MSLLTLAYNNKFHFLASKIVCSVSLSEGAKCLN